MLLLTFVATTQCDLNCRHCFRGDVQARHLPFEFVEQAIAGARPFGIQEIQLTGGEPFLYPHLDKIFDLARRERIPVSFFSNGLNIPAHAALLKKYRDVIKFIHISLESAQPEIYEKIRGKGNFSKVLRAFEFCRRQNIPFAVLTCVNRFNTEDLDGLVRFVRRQGGRQVTFTTVLPCPQAQANDLVCDEETRLRVLTQLRRIQRVASWDFFRWRYTAVVIGYPVYASSDIVMCENQMLRHVTIDVDGSVPFCTFLTVYDAPEAIRQKIKVASLAASSFDQALKEFSASLHKFHEDRMGDYLTTSKKWGLNFNSCFYCNAKFGLSRQGG